jgi:hypothetical protein
MDTPRTPAEGGEEGGFARVCVCVLSLALRIPDSHTAHPATPHRAMRAARKEEARPGGPAGVRLEGGHPLLVLASSLQALGLEEGGSRGVGWCLLPAACTCG